MRVALDVEISADADREGETPDEQRALDAAYAAVEEFVAGIRRNSEAAALSVTVQASRD